ncbi:MAG TPA: EthD family reductase [Drouetiella sp.]
MVKLVALYKKPADTQDFDNQYFNTHLPLANKMPGLKKVEVARVTGTPGGESEYYLMTELYFDSKEDLQTAMSSAEGRAAAKNLMSFAKDVTYMMFADVEKVPANAGA